SRVAGPARGMPVIEISGRKTDTRSTHGDRPMRAHSARISAMRLRTSSGVRPMGTFHSSAYFATTGMIHFGPWPPTTIGGGGRCPGGGDIGASKSEEYLPPEGGWPPPHRGAVTPRDPPRRPARARAAEN